MSLTSIVMEDLWLVVANKCARAVSIVRMDGLIDMNFYQHKRLNHVLCIINYAKFLAHDCGRVCTWSPYSEERRSD